MGRKHLIAIGAAITVAAAGTGALTYAVSGTESTTALDEFATVSVDGEKALDKDIVAGRIQSTYHPLPWIGTSVKAVQCPSALKAATRTRMTCTGTADGGDISIPVTVVGADGDRITWKFER